MRLIDADALLAKFNKKTDIWSALTDEKTSNEFALYCKVADAIEEMPSIGGWISVKDMLPENAKHPGAFCPRYLVYTDYGITEGWYNPDKECWYGYVSFMIDSNELNEWNIDLERGDVPKRVKNLPVKYWMPMPEPPKEETSDKT